MEVVIFGAKSSPATANYVLRKALLDYEAETDKTLSRSSEKLAKSFYMDDCLFSCMTEDAAKQLYAEVKEALGRGGFHLTKRRSSSPAVLSGVPESESQRFGELMSQELTYCRKDTGHRMGGS